MVKRTIFFLVILFTALSLYSFVNFAYPAKKNRSVQENHPPLVKITAPKNNSVYEWNSAVNYTITVSDQEDGESKFDEIPANEVFLQVNYSKDSLKSSIPSTAVNDGLATMRTSNCLNCHAFNTKLIGPSFYDINKRYTANKPGSELLVKHILEGSTGVWGNVAMPTHPELTKEETQNIVDWIIKNGAEQNVTYYRGTEGSLKIKPPVGPDGNGFLILTASYIDHGAKDNAKQKLRGLDVIILQTHTVTK